MLERYDIEFLREFCKKILPKIQKIFEPIRKFGMRFLKFLVDQYMGWRVTYAALRRTEVHKGQVAEIPEGYDKYYAFVKEVQDILRITGIDTVLRSSKKPSVFRIRLLYPPFEQVERRSVYLAFNGSREPIIFRVLDGVSINKLAPAFDPISTAVIFKERITSLLSNVGADK